ncbi:uncharacterized protein G2W53_011447 [Senna tora]|uniref:Uncharacterized protein n=1 Tax=Senna tora TaxID=362788 RepID=A0A834X1A3_9FABA|nr:uncharacterized protein G2W53_011447 [Senna tora]
MDQPNPRPFKVGFKFSQHSKPTFQAQPIQLKNSRARLVKIDLNI